MTELLHPNEYFCMDKWDTCIKDIDDAIFYAVTFTMFLARGVFYSCQDQEYF